MKALFNVDAWLETGQVFFPLVLAWAVILIGVGTVSVLNVLNP